MRQPRLDHSIGLVLNNIDLTSRNYGYGEKSTPAEPESEKA